MKNKTIEKNNTENCADAKALSACVVSLPNFNADDFKKIRTEANKAKKILFDKSEVSVGHSITVIDIKIILDTILKLWSN